ncbi:hypothetical protein PRABACTJOHN_03393, partial [Parabacteroides johnsonii DSM 18315]
AEAVAATRSAAERISFCLLFLFIKLFLFCAVQRVDGPLSGG